VFFFAFFQKLRYSNWKTLFSEHGRSYGFYKWQSQLTSTKTGAYLSN